MFPSAFLPRLQGLGAQPITKDTIFRNGLDSSADLLSIPVTYIRWFPQLRDWCSVDRGPYLRLPLRRDRGTFAGLCSGGVDVIRHGLIWSRTEQNINIVGTANVVDTTSVPMFYVGGGQIPSVMSKPPRAAATSGLTPAQRKSVFQIDREVSKLYLNNDTLVFVLGSFEDGKKERLEEFCELANNRPQSNVAAKLMDEFLADQDRDLQGRHKFKVIGSHADVIVGIAEHDRGGFVFEQGIIGEYPTLLDKAYLLRRNYPGNGNHEKYCWMQSGFFDALERRNHVYDWGQNTTFQTSAQELLDDLGL